MIPVGSQVTDARVAAPPTPPPARFPLRRPRPRRRARELGLAGLVLAGGAPGETAWALARGWADLDGPSRCAPVTGSPPTGSPGSSPPPPSLRLVADDRLRLDDPANDHLRTVRLADDAVTVRELLSHAGGVYAPRPAGGYAAPSPA